MNTLEIGLVVVVFVIIISWLLRRPAPFDFSKKRTFFVTGAASGIGKRMVERLLEKDQNVVAADINYDGLKESFKESSQKDNLYLVKLDITDSDMWEKVYKDAIARFNGIDIHMNIAGYLKPGYIYEFEAKEVNRHMDINVKGLIYGTCVASKHMKEKSSGHIVNIGSLASLAPFAGCSLYGASKYAVRSFSLAAATELKKFGIKVTVVCPDAVVTPMFQLQVNYVEAAYTFSGVFLTTDQVVNAIFDKGLSAKPVELWIPYHRGILMRIGDLTYGTKFFDLLDSIIFPQANSRRETLKLQQKKTS